MLKPGKPQAKPYLVLALSMTLIAVGATSVSRHAAQINPVVVFMIAGTLLSVSLFVITRRAARARDAAEAQARDLRSSLRTSEERYRLAAQATNDAICDCDLITGLVQWNEGIRTLFGYSAEQVGTEVTWRFEQIHPDDRE